MTDINVLAKRIKAAAVRAKTATEEYASGHMSVSVCYAECEEFNRLTDGPDQILPLVEALEKAQEQVKTIESRNRRLEGIIDIAERRIAELDSRTVTVKLPSTRLWAGVTECYEKSAVIGAIRAAGMEVSDD